MISNPFKMQKRTRRCTEQDRDGKLFLKELPYFTGCLTLYHRNFNNSLIQNQLTTKRQLENLSGLHDVDLFRLKSNLVGSLYTKCPCMNNNSQPIDKQERVHNNSASLIDNIFINNADQVLISGNTITCLIIFLNFVP